MNLRNAVVIVTGASSGIGQATARVLAEAGAHLVLVARSADQLHAFARELAVQNSEPLVVPADITQPDAATTIVEATRARWDRIDVVINNAGIGIQANVAALPVEQAQYVFEVNLWGPLRLIQ